MSTHRSLFLLIKSWRVRIGLLWFAHNSAAPFAPLALVGLLVVLDWPVPTWAPTTAGWLMTGLMVAMLAGFRLHHEMDGPGVPCRWCELDLEEDRA